MLIGLGREEKLAGLKVHGVLLFKNKNYNSSKQFAETLISGTHGMKQSNSELCNFQNGGMG